MPPGKVFTCLARAIPKVLRRVDCRFIIGGVGNPPEIKAEVDREMNVGYAPSARVPELCATADVCVLSSLYENFPISVLEAMASECAVAATDTCGIPEMMEHGVDGLVVRPGDADSLADSIVRLAEDEDLWISLEKRAREKVGDRFNWARAVAVTSEYK